MRVVAGTPFMELPRAVSTRVRPPTRTFTIRAFRLSSRLTLRAIARPWLAGGPLGAARRAAAADAEGRIARQAAQSATAKPDARFVDASMLPLNRSGPAGPV